MVTSEDLAVLTKGEIFLIIPKKSFSRSEQHWKNVLCEALLRRSEKEIQALANLAQAKRDSHQQKVGNKRKRGEEVMERRTFRRVLDDIKDYLTDPGQFMQVPTKEEVQQCHRAYLQATCNAAMSRRFVSHVHAMSGKRTGRNKTSVHYPIIIG
jgi:hypothetical protein